MISEIASVFGIAKTAIDIGKEAKEMLPSGKDKDHIEKQLALAEKELSIAEANSAKELGYDLCKCTFPPQIMLYNNEKRASVCPKCNHSLSKAMTVDIIETKSKWNDFI